MSIAGLFDHRAEVWRPVEARGFAAEVVQKLEAVHQPTTGTNCAFAVAKLRTENIGPGETPLGRVDLFMSIGLSVEERDVLRIVAGPEAPSRWVVVSAARPRNHHIEAVVEPWFGRFPDETVAS